MKSWIIAHKFQFGLLIALLVIAATVGPFLYDLRAAPPAQTIWYYDLNTKALFEAPDGGPRITAASGPHDGQPAGVRAYVFSCTSCEDKSTHFIGYLETLDATLLQQLKPEDLKGWYGQRGPPQVQGVDEAMMVRRVEDADWVPSQSSQGQDILNLAGKQCPEARSPTFCPTWHIKPR